METQEKIKRKVPNLTQKEMLTDIAQAIFYMINAIEEINHNLKQINLTINPKVKDNELHEDKS